MKVPPMPRTHTDVERLLEGRDEVSAHDRGSRDLDFKEWDTRNLNRPVRAGMNAVSLFSNCGAGDIGFAAAGFEFQVISELVEKRLDVAMLNHPDAVPVPGDLRLTWPNVVDAFRESHGSKRPVVLSGCPPCQGMSSARGERGKEDDPDVSARDERNLLGLPIAHATSELKPTFVVVENVAAFLRRKVWDPEGGAPISAARILCDRLEADYRVFGALVDLCEFGVPQTRLRAFLAFVRKGSAALEALEESGRAPFPAPTHGAARELSEVVTLGDALKASRFPPLDAASPETATSENDDLHRVPVWRDRRYEMVAAIRAGSGGSAWDTDDCRRCDETAIVSTAATCPVCEEPLLRPITKDRDGSWRLVRGFRNSSYRRMDPGRPAATITTASGHIGSDRNIHPKVRQMIGEAVPPRFTKLHGRVLAALAEGRETPPTLSQDDVRCQRALAKLGGG